MYIMRNNNSFFIKNKFIIINFLKCILSNLYIESFKI